MADEHQARIVTIPAEPEPIQIDVVKTAVIVVDMQNAFVKRSFTFRWGAVLISRTGVLRIHLTT
jgi:hypothetical protein